MGWGHAQKGIVGRAPGLNRENVCGKARQQKAVERFCERLANLS
jgi:hypothetical protein